MSEPLNVTISSSAQYLGLDAPELASSIEQDSRVYLRLKRLFDVILALTALVALAPLFLVIAVLIRLDSKGPVVFTQERVGYDPKTRTPRTFKFYKFRSMRQDADPEVHRAHVTNLIQNHVAPRAGQTTLKMVQDQRITRVGHILRVSSLDELPQLFNVLKGDMSMVGPRPALPYEVALYEDWHRRRLEALPGITGWWQVKGRNRVSFDEMVRMDIDYIEHQSLGLDLKIMLLTPWAAFSGKGAG